MRITHLLWLGISLSLTTALTTVDNADESSPKQTTPTPLTTKAAVSTTESEGSKSTGATTTRAAKSIQFPGDSRGKRTLNDFSNGYLYADVANRRAGYVANTNSYYPQNGYYNGQNAVAQYPHHYPGHYPSYPQYLEAPEPIIEIIIKDSNETLPAVEQEPIITKKKKEKVHVFYVNYKKDHNNKLHLESPIASLNNDDTEEEEEEIVHIPAAVTPPPPLKTTTLRTVIHPDSEKYHSNSGIHVTFGTEDKSQSGHVLEEHDSESIQRHVVALPEGSNPNALNGLKSEDFNAPPQPRVPVGNQLIESPFQHAQYYQTQQQLPSQHNPLIFRQQAAFTKNQHPPPSPPPQVPVKQQFYQKLPQQQPAKFIPPQAPLLPQPQALYSKVTTTQQQLQQRHQQQNQQQHLQQFQHQQQQQSHYYSNFNQQYPQFYEPLTHKPAPSPKPSFAFPTVPAKIQELPSQHTPAPYQPIKFRPTAAPLPHIKPVPIPAKLENTNYQTESTAHQYKAQSHYQNYQQQQQQQQQQQYPTEQQQPPKAPVQPSTPYYFNRQPQFVRNPSFSVQSPAIPSHYKTQTPTVNTQNPIAYVHQKFAQGSTSIANYQTQLQAEPQAYISQILEHQNSYQTNQNNQHLNTQQQQQRISATIPSVATPTPSSNQKPPSGSLGPLQTFYDIQPSRETELLKAIPKFEQHITETIHHPIGPHAQIQSQASHNSFSYNNQNQVIHDIPAPNLGPIPQPQQHQQQHHQQQQQQQSQQSQSNYINITPGSQNGHYITAGNLNSQPSQQFNYITATVPSTTSAPQYAETKSGQKVMIVTPMPPIIYNQYHSTHYNQEDSSSIQSQNPTQRGQSSILYRQEPRQSQSQVQSGSSGSDTSNSQYSVSTFHSDVFKELEQRKQQQEKNDQHKEQYQIQTHLSANQQQSPQTDSSQTDYIPTQQLNIAERQKQAAPENNPKASQTLLQLPDEVPDDLRQQLLSSGILNNADISVLDYDKVGSVNLENLPAEHLQHFYGNGGGAQISESRKVLNVVKPNGEQVSLSEKELERVKSVKSIPQRHNLDVKVVRFDANNEKNVANKYLKAGSTIVPPVDIGEKQYNRYLPLKINGAQFPIPDTEELKDKKVVSVVVLAPVEGDTDNEARSANSGSGSTDVKEVKFFSGDLIKTLVKKPTKENFKRWLEKEAKTDVEQQSVVLLVTKSSKDAEEEIFMYDISMQVINKLNGELSSKFVSVAEENASTEDLEHASTLGPSALEQMMRPSASHS